VLVTGLDDAAGVAAMTAAMGSSCDVSGAAHLPRAVAAKIDSLSPAAKAVTALRIEGVPPSVNHRRDALAALLKPFGAVDTLDAARSRALWQAVRDAMPFAAETGAARPLWRISTIPARGAALGGQIVSATGAEIFYDWAGGLLWLQLDPADDAGAAAIRRATADHGGHATLIRAPTAARAAVDVFEPQDPGLAALTKRVKDSFDPKGILNPGRMWAGV
jgi:glycolate oxidase FAD binding subunit